MSERDDSGMRELAAAYALGALSPGEAREFEAWLARSPEARREVAEFREVNALLAQEAPGMRPPADLRERVLDRVRHQSVVPPAPRRIGRSRVPTPIWIGLAASVVAALGLGALLVQNRRELAAREATVDSLEASLVQTQQQLAHREQTLNSILEPGVELSVLNTTGTPQPRIQLFWNRQTHVAMVHAFNLTPAQSGRVYQLWFIQDGRPIPSVTFNSEPSGHAMVEHVPMPAGELTHAAVTLEPPGGSQAPTSPVMLIGSLES